MRNFVTSVLLLSALLLGATTAGAQLVNTPIKKSDIAASRGLVTRQIQPQTAAAPVSEVFLPGKGGLTSALSKSEQLSYYTDTTNNFFPRRGCQDSLLGNVAGNPVTFYSWGYGERLSTSLKNAYLDSVQVFLGIVNVPATNSLLMEVTHSKEDTLRSNNQVVPGIDLHSTAITSSKVLGSALTQGFFQQVTFKMAKGGKLLAAKDHNFWVFINQGGVTPGDDSVIFTFDQNIQAQRDLDTTIDRCNVGYLDAAQKYFIEEPFANNFRLNTDTTMYLYQNMILIAYLHDPSAGVAESTNQPASTRLAQNFPNPFNPSTEIDYALQYKGPVTLKVYNALGQEVANLVDQVQAPGEHSVKFDASELPSGTYIYTLKAGSFSQSQRMVLSK